MLHHVNEGFDGVGDDGGSGRVQMDPVGQQAVTVASGNGGQTAAQHETPDLDAQVAGVGHVVEVQFGRPGVRPQKGVHLLVDRQVGNPGLAGHGLDGAAVGLGLAIGLVLRVLPERRQR